MTQKTFKVSGMKCPHCQANVENALQGVAGVQMAEAHLAEGSATVVYDENIVRPEMLKDAVDALGRFELTL